jgi:hypothetical protein
MTRAGGRNGSSGPAPEGAARPFASASRSPLTGVHAPLERRDEARGRASMRPAAAREPCEPAPRSTVCVWRQGEPRRGPRHLARRSVQTLPVWSRRAARSRSPSPFPLDSLFSGSRYPDRLHANHTKPAPAGEGAPVPAISEQSLTDAFLPLETASLDLVYRQLGRRGRRRVWPTPPSLPSSAEGESS